MCIRDSLQATPRGQDAPRAMGPRRTGPWPLRLSRGPGRGRGAGRGPGCRGTGRRTRRGHRGRWTAGAWSSGEAGSSCPDGRRGTTIRPRQTTTPRQSIGLDVPDGSVDLSRGNPDPALLPDLGPALATAAAATGLYGEDPWPWEHPDLVALLGDCLLYTSDAARSTLCRSRW